MMVGYDPNKLLFIIGPCVVESLEVLDQVAYEVNKIFTNINADIVFKSSYRKANRSNFKSFQGIGDINALELLHDVSKKYNFRCTTDVHSTDEVVIAAEYVDIIQIPAFLARQTDLLIAAGETGKTINVKKGQFMSASSMEFVIEKIESVGNKNIWLTERGNFFGYQDLVVDFRNIPEMLKFGKPVIMDCTHSLQKPNQLSGVTGGNPELIETIARAATAVGVNGLFIETHPRPNEALSDGANMLQLDKLESIVNKMVKLKNYLNDIS